MKLPETHRRRASSRSPASTARARLGTANRLSFLAKPFDLNVLLDMLGGKPN
jgi:hypothetical protein